VGRARRQEGKLGKTLIGKGEKRGMDNLGGRRCWDGVSAPWQMKERKIHRKYQRGDNQEVMVVFHERIQPGGVGGGRVTLVGVNCLDGAST